MKLLTEEDAKATFAHPSLAVHFVGSRTTSMQISFLIGSKWDAALPTQVVLNIFSTVCLLASSLQLMTFCG